MMPRRASELKLTKDKNREKYSRQVDKTQKIRK